MSYYDVDAILTDAQKIPTTFNLEVANLGHLAANPNAPLKSGSSIPLPLWLSTLLALSSPTPTTSLVTLDLPPALSPAVLSALRADPLSIDLRALAPYFYSLGTRMLELFDEDDVLNVLTDSWKKRAVELGDFASTVGGKEGGGQGKGDKQTEFLRGLEEGERELFRRSHESAKAMRKWMGEARKG